MNLMLYLKLKRLLRNKIFAIISILYFWFSVPTCAFSEKFYIAFSRCNLSFIDRELSFGKILKVIVKSVETI